MLKVVLLSLLVYSNIETNENFQNKQKNSFNLKHSYEHKLLLAIKQDDFPTIENIISNNLIKINEHYEGKTFVIWAAINNKPEIVRLLVNYGADISKRCDLGFTIEDHCLANNSIEALSEIVVLKA